MHYDAEYGTASHWMYKNAMKATLKDREQHGVSPTDDSYTADSDTLSASEGTPLSSSDYHERVHVGQAAICVDEGHLLDAVVVLVYEETTAVLVATTQSRRWHTAESLTRPLCVSAYADMLNHAQRHGLSVAGQHDDLLQVRLFCMTSSSKHVRVDHLGGVNRYCTLSFVTACPDAMPSPHVLPLQPTASATMATVALTSGGAQVRDGRIGKWPRFQANHAGGMVDSDKVVHLRAALEWGDEAAAVSNGEPATHRHEMPESKRELYAMTNADGLVLRAREESGASSAEITVLLEPGGLCTVPRGATARDVVKEYGLIELSGGPATGLTAGSPAPERIVNVNNELVSEDTLLHAGDLIVLSNHVLDDV
jgi:hypothetical protein